MVRCVLAALLHSYTHSTWIRVWGSGSLVTCGVKMMSLSFFLSLPRLVWEWIFLANAKKTSECRLPQNFTSLCASAVQAPCKFRASLCTCNAKALYIFIQRFRVARAHVGIRWFHTACIRVAWKSATQNWDDGQTTTYTRNEGRSFRLGLNSTMLCWLPG